MDGSRPGEAGVLAWCNSIRFNMAKDPGRQILHDQIQTQGFDFLDNYLESFFEGPRNEPVIELLKTPGRKKNAPTRTRAAIAAAEKSRAITSSTFEDHDTKANGGPVNEFHKALLRVKERADEETSQPTASSKLSSDRLVKPSASFAKLKSQKIVTIADSPAVPSPARDDHGMDLDEGPGPIPAVNFHLGPPSTEPVTLETTSHDDVDPIKELSMIAEDDEPAERSRASLQAPAVRAETKSPSHSQPAMPSDPQDVFHEASPDSPPMQAMQTDDEPEDLPPTSTDEPEEPSISGMTFASANTFHSIPLDSPQAPEPPHPTVRPEDHHTAPLPKVSLPPVPVEDEAYSHTAPLPSSSHHEEYTMPLRGEAPIPVPGLSRKASVTQFAGLPAPSPLRKSLRVPGDPTATSGGTSIPPAAAKRTSWLSKAKSLETTAKRTSTLSHGLGITAFSNNNKRKSGEMLESARDISGSSATLKVLDEESRIAKVPKLAGSPAEFTLNSKGKARATSPDTVQDAAPRSALSVDVAAVTTTTTTAASVASPQEETDVLDLLKKTTSGFGARVGKSAGKSLGGNAAAALAEARARAEARVAERLKLEMGIATDTEDVSMTSDDIPAAADIAPSATAPRESERRLSISDLVPTSHIKKAPANASSSKSPPPLEADTSTSTTPPNSPPPPQLRTASFLAPASGPVFSKPVVPAAAAAAPAAPPRDAPSAAPSVAREFSFKLPPNPFVIPAAMTLGVGSKFAPLSAQSSKASIFSDVVFDTGNVSPHPSWMPSTQDTSYSAGGSQSQGGASKDVRYAAVNDNDNDDVLDEDDSWGVEEKFAAHQTWTPFGFSSADQGTGAFKDDTWSTNPSQSTSQRLGLTGVVAPATQSLFSSLPQGQDQYDDERVEEEAEPEDFATRLAAAAQQPSEADDGVNEEADMAMQIDDDVEDAQDDAEKSDLEEAILAGKPTITLVKQQSRTDLTSGPRSESQQSMASTASSSQQSQLGFFGQASKLVSSVLGGGKKTKPEVKSLQLAAAAAKKQQEELEKKATRMKEMENRRQQAMQRKAEEEKTRALEEERKIKEEADRRKREREEHTDKRPLRNNTATTKKADEDNTQKRKLATAPTQSQKPPSKDKKDMAAPPRPVKPSAGPAASSSKPSGLPKSALKQPASSVPTTPGAAKAAPKTVKHVASSGNLKSSAIPAASKGKAPARDASEPPAAKSSKQPMKGGPPAEAPRVASESIELPDINSEYSDSDDEDRPKRELPDWAQSPDVAAALQQQSTINPDDIFGRIGPLRMDEIFRTRQSRFRARTSSANWTGTDELTAEEEREYARRMGFR